MNRKRSARMKDRLWVNARRHITARAPEPGLHDLRANHPGPSSHRADDTTEPERSKDIGVKKKQEIQVKTR